MGIWKIYKFYISENTRGQRHSGSTNGGNDRQGEAGDNTDK